VGYAHCFGGTGAVFSYNCILGGYGNCLYNYTCYPNCSQWDFVFNCNAITGGTLNCIFSCLYGDNYPDVGEGIGTSKNKIYGGNTNKIVGCSGQNGSLDPTTIWIGQTWCNRIFGGLQNHIVQQAAPLIGGSQTYADLRCNAILGGFQNRICGGYHGYGARVNVIAGTRDSCICTGGKTGGDIENVFIGSHCVTISSSACCAVSQFNAISKTTNNFAIPHPDPEKCNTHKLYHTTLESPTAGDNLYRYRVLTKNGCATYELPSYYKFLNCNDQVWLTPKDHTGNAWGCVNTSQTEIHIKSDQDGEYNVMLIGTRKDELAQRAWKGVERFSQPTNINEEENGRGLEFK